MPRELASRLNAVSPSITLQMNARAQEMRARGVDVFAFGVGEPDFEPPPAVLVAAKKAIDTGVSKYTAVTGIAPLKEAICMAAERTRGYRPKPEEICVSTGAKHALFNIALTLYEPGDEVVIPTPAWISYAEQVRLMGATPVFVASDEANGWKLSPAALAAALTPKTKAVIICSPSNPTGATYKEAEMRALLQAVRGHDCWLVFDEIYAELVYDGIRVHSARALAPDLVDRMIIIDGVAKTYAMTGWRIGWSIAPPHLTKAIDIVQGQSTTNATAVAQHAARQALMTPPEDFEVTRKLFERRRDVMIEGLNSIPGISCRKPDGAFYAFADCRGLYGIQWGGQPLQSDEDIALFLLDQAHVATVPGGAFGAPGYVRFSYAVDEARIRAGIEAIRHAVTHSWNEDHTGQFKIFPHQ